MSMSQSEQDQELRITTSKEDLSDVLSLIGEIDMASAPELQRACMAAVDDGAKKVILDTSGVTFIDSTGLGVIIALQKRLRAEGGEASIRNPSSVLRRLIQVTNLDRVVPVEGEGVVDRQ
jgi:anti-sigma B factor antagonist